jgi:mannuronan 5-epimerase
VRISRRPISRRRPGGYLIVVVFALGLGMILTFTLGRTYPQLALQKEPFDRLSYVPSFDPIEDVTLGLSPNAGNVIAEKPNGVIRAIEILPTQTLLLAGGRDVRTIETPAPATLQALARIVADPSWISESGHTITMHAAVIAENGSSLTVAAPVTTELVMQVRQGVFLAASAATLTLAGVDVHASDTHVPTTFSRPQQVDGRPFILATVNSRMTIQNSSFRYLGRDWNSSYGVTWSKGSTGWVTGSTFEHNFIGVYTNASNGIRIQHNQLAYNSLYGIDPHTGSRDLLIEYNVSNYNGRHGIIFSDHVTGGKVRYNTTIGNGLNGIMMDAASTDNRIVHNTVVGNRSDGIVLADSSNNNVTDNRVANNRIGVNVRGATKNTELSGNVIENNRMAAQGIGVSHNQVNANGGEWSSRRIGTVWLGVLGLLLVLVVLTWISGHSDGRNRRGIGGRITEPSTA